MRDAQTPGRLTPRQLATAVACLLVIAAVGIVNHNRAHRRGLVSTAPNAGPASAGPTPSALSCTRQLADVGTHLLSVADVWPGSGGGGDIDTAVDVTACARSSADPATAGAACRLDVFSELNDSGDRYLAGLGAATVRSRQLVHGPLAAVTETVVSLPTSAESGVLQLREMIRRCESPAAQGALLTTVIGAIPGAARSVIVLEFDDDSLTSTLRATILARAAQAFTHA